MSLLLIRIATRTLKHTLGASRSVRIPRRKFTFHQRKRTHVNGPRRLLCDYKIRLSFDCSTKSTFGAIKAFLFYLEIGSEVFGDEGAVALGQHHDLLLDVLDLILGLLQVDDFDGNDLRRTFVDALEHLAERPFADPFLFREYQLRINLLKKKKKNERNKSDCSVEVRGSVRFSGLV